MDINKTIEHITSGFKAYHEIQQRKKAPRDETENPVLPGKKTRLIETLQVIANHSPGTYKTRLENALQKSSYYSEHYKNMKQHAALIKDQGMNKDNMLKTLGYMKPVIGRPKGGLIEKIEKIFEILNS